MKDHAKKPFKKLTMHEKYPLPSNLDKSTVLIMCGSRVPLPSGNLNFKIYIIILPKISFGPPSP